METIISLWILSFLLSFGYYGLNYLIMTYFSYLQNELDNVFKKWKKLGFLNYGIIENGKVIKDILE